MYNELQFIIAQLKEAYEGDPWFGRSADKLLSEVPADMAFEKPNGQHSLAELVWHMINWKEFAISRMEAGGKELSYFEENDWRELDHNDQTLWQKGVDRLHETQRQLIALLAKQEESILDKNVAGREYTYRKLAHGILQHDIYHLGQIAYLVKLLKK